LKVKNGGKACNSSYLRSRRILSFRPAGARLLIPYLKNKMIKHKKVGGIAQVVEHLPSMHKALNSIYSIRKKERERTNVLQTHSPRTAENSTP
jgi:hypothetical protein